MFTAVVGKERRAVAHAHSGVQGATAHAAAATMADLASGAGAQDSVGIKLQSDMLAKSGIEPLLQIWQDGRHGGVYLQRCEWVRASQRPRNLHRDQQSNHTRAASFGKTVTPKATGAGTAASHSSDESSLSPPVEARDSLTLARWDHHGLGNGLCRSGVGRQGFSGLRGLVGVRWWHNSARWRRSGRWRHCECERCFTERASTARI